MSSLIIKNMKNKFIIILSIIFPLFFSCQKLKDPFNSFQWDNPYDLNNEIQLSLAAIPDTIFNHSNCTIQWTVKANRKGEPVRDFDLKISLYRDNIFLEEITRCKSNDKSFPWRVNVLKPYYSYKIQIKSVENFSIQDFSNEFIIKK